MILLITNSVDTTSSEVCAWINCLGELFLRINSSDKETHRNFHIELDNTIHIDYVEDSDENVFHFSKVKSVWYRKMGKPHYNLEFNKSISKNTEDTINQHISIELLMLKQLIYQNNISIKSLGQADYSHYNKFTLLKIATKVGLNIPPTLITTSKDKLIQFANKHKKIITKCLGNGVFLSIDSLKYGLYTTLVSKDTLASLPVTLFPSLFQKYIEKQYEIRVFYLNGKCYSMAIFSQSDIQTEVDFRKYIANKPNRTVPYQLPEQLESKINELMDILNLNTGSLDFIRNKEGEYIFLEVNPTGQFKMVSYPCNYFLEKKVADFLCTQN